MKQILTPFNEETMKNLKSGDEVLISGIIYTMRDAAHEIIINMLNKKQELPFNLNNQVIYYCGPTPAKPKNIIGSCGPTTSSRMGKYTPVLLDNGLKGMIGKGERNIDVKDSIIKNKAVYFAALGGLGAEYAKNIISSKIIAFPELGPEAIYKLNVENFYAVVINDIYGHNFYTNNSKI